MTGVQTCALPISTAKAAVVYGLDITKQEEVDAMAKAIQEAVTGLVLKGDKKPEQGEVKPNPSNPSTGDTLNLVPVMLLLVISGGLGIQILRRKRDN